jgi:hypothetical protein
VPPSPFLSRLGFALKPRDAVGLALLVGALGGCSSAAPDGATESTSPASIEAPSGCPVATRPSLVTGSCEPVGPSLDVAAVPGFERDPSGWGFAAILPPETCTGATMALLGHRECQPVDDCAAAFPPAGADVVVHAGEKLAAAIASVKAGGLVAVDAGEYEAVEIRKSVRIVGRCASQVIIRSPNTFPTAPAPGTKDKGGGTKGIDIYGAAVTVDLRSITVRGFVYGIYDERAKLTVDRVVLSGNRAGVQSLGAVDMKITRSVVEPHPDYPRSDAVGVSTSLLANKVRLEEIDVRGMDVGISANSPDTVLTMRRSVVHDELQPTYRGTALEAMRGATVHIEESALSTEKGVCAVAGQFVGDPPELDAKAGAASLSIARSALLHQSASAPDATARDGVMILWSGAVVSLEDVSVQHASVGAFAVTTGSSLSATRTVVAAHGSASPNHIAFGVYDSGSKIALEDSAIVDAAQIGVLAHGRDVAVTLTRSLVTGTREQFRGDFTDLGGTGQALAVGHRARLDVTDSALVGNEGVGVLGLDQATLRFDTVLVDDTRAARRGGLGAGIGVIGSTLHLAASTVRKSADAAIAFDAASGIVTSSMLIDNGIAIRTSGGTTVVQSKTAPLDLEEGHAVLHATRLERNASSFSDQRLPVE